VKQLFFLLFLSGFSLSACRQRQPIYLPSCTFCDNADSSGNDYPGVLNLRNVYRGTKTCYKDASFGDTAIFKLGIFMDTAVFTDASFADYVDFSDAVFSKAAYFDDVTFGKQVYFDHVRFPHYAKFTNLQHTDSVTTQFNNAILPDTLDFSQNSALGCTIDLTTANFDEPHPCNIFLFNTDISKFKLDYFHFRLLLPDSTITPSYNTNRQKITKDQKEAMYEALLNNFKQKGQEESYKRLDIEYQKFKWQNSWAYGISWVPAIWWNYGYDKEYIFLWIIGSLLVFSFINSRCLGVLNAHVYEVFKPGVFDEKAGYGRKLWQSVIYTGNIFFRLTLDRDCMKFEKWGPTLYLFVVYVLGVLCLGYLANFILQQSV
jgi:hypothetical protein